MNHTGQRCRVLGIVGSGRSRFTADALLKSLERVTSFDQAHNLIYNMAMNRKICNTEGAMIAAGCGVIAEQGDLGLVRLKDYFPDSKTPSDSQLDDLLRTVLAARGLVMASPVYFGDRSSQVEALFSLLGRTSDFPLLGKVVGFVSTGAKRNGGQETTNVLGLSDSLALGANIIGNGPPTGQYGGTIVAGDLGAVVDDNFGLMTAYGTGRRVSSMASVPLLKPVPLQGCRLAVVYTSRPPQWLKSIVQDALPKQFLIDEYFLDELDINRCLACSPCPNSKAKAEEYLCRQKDGMVDVRQGLMEADGLLLIGVLMEGRGLEPYQIFAERTRFIRRNNFELSNLPVGVAVFSDRYREPNFLMRATNWALRHNTLIIGPGYTGRVTNQTIWPDIKSMVGYFEHLHSQVIRYRNLRLQSGDDYVYEPIGYQL